MFADLHLALWPVLFSMQDEDMSESSAASEPDENEEPAVSELQEGEEPAVLVWWRLLRRECCFHIRHSVQVRPRAHSKKISRAMQNIAPEIVLKSSYDDA